MTRQIHTVLNSRGHTASEAMTDQDTKADVIRELRFLYFRPTIASIAREAGLHRDTLDKAIRSGCLSARSLRALEPVLRKLENDRSQNRLSHTIYERLEAIR